ncbi:MAG: diacylglycerol kinase family protein [Prosthecobacter sp.]
MLRWSALVIRSFGPALAGLAWALRTQRNLQVHAIALCVVVALGLWLRIAAWEWCAVLLASGMVWAAELLNTALEVLSDRVSTAREEAIRRVKDVAAAAVLVAALAAVVVGLLIFAPKVWEMF